MTRRDAINCVAPLEGPITLEAEDGAAILVATEENLDDALRQHPTLYLRAVGKDGRVGFATVLRYGHVEPSWPLAPSVVLRSGDGRWLGLLPVSAPLPADELRVPPDALRAVPILHPDWSIHRVEELERRSASEIATALGGAAQAVTVQPTALQELGKVGRARVYRDVDREILDRTLTISQGASKKERHWRTARPTIGTLFTTCASPQIGAKDGRCIMFADMADGDRKLTAVRSASAVVLDVDSGLAGSVTDERLLMLDVTCLRYTTHSHGSGQTALKQRVLATYAAKHFRGQDWRSDEVIRDYLLRVKGMLPEYVSSVEFDRLEHNRDGVEAIVRHLPTERYRIIFPLREPFVVMDRGASEREARDLFARGVASLGRQLGLTTDSTESQLNRLFYLPRVMSADSPFEASIFGGALLAFDDIQLDGGGSGGGGRRRFATPEGLTFWAEGGKRIAKTLQAASMFEALCPEHVGARKSDGLLPMACPNADAHSSGDPDDLSAFAVDAGEGTEGDSYVFSCQHDGCRGLAGAGLLAKAIEEGWIAREDAFDPEWNDNGQIDQEPAEVDFDATLSELEEAGRGAGRGAGVTRGEAETAASLFPWLVQTHPLLDLGEKRVHPGPDAVVNYYKQRIASVLEGGKHRLAYCTPDTGLVLTTPNDLKGLLQSSRAVWEEEKIDGRNGKPKAQLINKPALDIYLSDPSVPVFYHVDCRPKQRVGKNTLDLWQGIATVPRAGRCPLIEAHLLKSTAGEDQATVERFKDWLAHMLLQPQEKPSWSFVIQGDKAAGKTTPGKMLCEAIGPAHAIKVSDPRHLSGNFNSHRRHRLFLLAEETVWGGNRSDASILNDIISSDTMMLEKKGVDAYEQHDFCRFMFISDQEHAISAGRGERRYAVTRAKDIFAGLPKDHPDRLRYFGCLWNEWRGGGAEAFLWDLLHRDLRDFNPYGAPVTQSLLDQVVLSLKDQERWVYNALLDGGFTMRDGMRSGPHWPMDAVMEIDAADVQASFESHVRRYGGSAGGTQAVLAALRPYGEPAPRRPGARGARRYTYEFQPRRQWQEAFTEVFGVTFPTEKDDVPEITTKVDAKVVALAGAVGGGSRRGAF